MILIDPALDSDPNAVGADAVARLFLRTHPKPEKISARALAGFLAKAQSAVRLRGQVTVLLSTDATLRDLNRRFRGKDKPTDVLSFPVTNLFQSEEKGDLAISVETARRQGAACGHSLGTELKILMLHGLLHLAGYDHESDAGQMARREQLLRGRLGLPTGLLERSSAPKLRPTAGGRREAGEIAPDEVRRETPRTQSGEGNPKSGKPRRGGANRVTLSTRRRRT